MHKSKYRKTVGNVSYKPLIAQFTLLVFLLSASFNGFATSTKVFRYAFGVAETGFDPVIVSDRYSNIVIENILEPMLAYDYLARPAKLVPNTLEGMPTVSDNGATYIFKLKKGIFFTPDPAFKNAKRELIAQDYSYSLRRLHDPKLRSPWSFLIEGKIIGAEAVTERAKKSGKYDYDASIEGLQVIDRYTLKLRLKEPDYNMLYILAMPATSAVAREVVEHYGNDVSSHPVGTGPFVLKQWRRSSKIVLEANPNYREEYFQAPTEVSPEDQEVVNALHGKKLPIIDRVEINIIEESQPLWLAFLNNQHDSLGGVPNEFINIAIPGGKLAPNLAKQGIYMQRQSELDLTFTFYNMRDPIIGGYSPEKIALRRALNLAYDNQTEIKVLRKSQAIQAQSPIPPGAAGYDPEFRTTMSEYNPAKAKALLDLFGYTDKNGDGWRDMPDGKPLVLQIASPPGSSQRESDELWRKSMQGIGIRIGFKKERWPDLVKQGKLGKIQVGNYLSWAADYPDADNFFQLLYGPNSSQSNEAHFELPAFDQLYEKAKKMPDSPERTGLYRQMTELFLVYAPWKLGTHRVGTALRHHWIKGLKSHPISHATWKYIDIDVDAQQKANK